MVPANEGIDAHVAPQSVSLLRACHHWPRRPCANQRNELMPHHCRPETNDRTSYRQKLAFGKGSQCPLWATSGRSASID